MAQRVNQRLQDLKLRSPLPQSIPAELPTQSTIPSEDLNLTMLPDVNYIEDFDFDDKVQAMGFVGEHSEMTWLYRLKRDLDHDSSSPIKENPERPAISSVYYFQGNSQIPVAEDVNLARWPPQYIADRLVRNYFHNVHAAFPIIGKVNFLRQYRSFYASPTMQPGERWLALLNMVFAIATRHECLSDQSQTDHDEHHVYFSRAWKLTVNYGLVDRPNLRQIQVEGMAAFYLLSVGDVDRSWSTIGLAIRSAMTMGLNLRSEIESITHFSKELRYRIWWALFMLDTVLCEITGRPPTTGHKFCTTPLPIPFAEEDLWDERAVQLVANQGTRSAFFTSLLSDAVANPSSETFFPSNSGQQTASENLTPNASLYFLYAVDITHLLREAVDLLYAPGSARQPWLEIESAISTLNATADNWVSRLPVEFRLTTSDPTQQFAQQRIGLVCRFYATKLIILQPCLRRLSRKSSEANTPGTVCEHMGAICVLVACQMIDLLPDEVDITWLYSVAPWWCILHNIMQATSILLAELLIPTIHTTADTITKIKKAIRWLHKMSAKDPSSWRAWVVCTEMLSRHCSGLA